MVKKILVVDDDPGTLKLVGALLKSKNFDVLFAEDGLDALVKIQNENPDLVVLDVMLPEINGYDICYQLRFNKAFKKVPIILMTTRDQEMSDKIGQKSNIEYMSKPINSKLLFENLDRLLS
ncbi:MAG: response regulator [Candidatus Omnitrophica bacterium]|nr:response regulator [Candidatus Omnitrophota bacterium]